MSWLTEPYIKWALPIPLLFAVAPLVWWFFRDTWRELDADALRLRQTLHDSGQVDRRPMIAMVMASMVLALHHFFGTTDFYDRALRPALAAFERNHPTLVDMGLYDELYGKLWWGMTRVLGYVTPLLLWRLFFPRDHLLDFGLRVRGFGRHVWIYALFLTVMVPLLVTMAHQPDFGTFYPMYRHASRSWLDFAIWEIAYIAQFLGLEIFFRGWWLRALRSLGSAAIFAMVVPYCMIHFGKPYPEACGAIVAGVVLGSLAMKTRSIYSGVLVHGTVAILMDMLALQRRGALPVRLSPTSPVRLAFPHLSLLVWGVWSLAVLLLLLHFRSWRLGRSK